MQANSNLSRNTGVLIVFMFIYDLSIFLTNTDLIKDINILPKATKALLTSIYQKPMRVPSGR